MSAHNFRMPEDDHPEEARASIIPSPRARENNLPPPAGTSFYSFQTHTFLNTRENGVQINWRADIYIYATNAKPTDPDFAQKGGRLIIVMVHEGFASFSGELPTYWSSMSFYLKPLQSGLVPSLQLPAEPSGNNGDIYNYTIDYGQAMQMFKNNGNEPFTFNASYHETFTRDGARQRGIRGDNLEMEIVKPIWPHTIVQPELYGLSVFTHTDPSKFPLKLGWEFNTWRETGPLMDVHGEWDLQLGF